MYPAGGMIALLDPFQRRTVLADPGNDDEAPDHLEPPEEAVDDLESDPRGKLMHEVADQMDAIETDFGDGYQIARVITIVEVIGSDGKVELRVRAGQYPWVSLGMLEFAKKSIEATMAG
jgi:hypothetical protein